MRVEILPSGKSNMRLLAAICALTVMLLVVLGGLVAACGGEETASAVSRTASTAPAVVATGATTPTNPAVTTPPSATSTTMPVTMSKAEIGQWKTDAIAFADRFYGAWPDADATFVEFADEAAFYDPSNGDFTIAGKSGIIEIHRDFFSYFPNIKAHRGAVYLSADGAAYRLIVDTIWPPWVPEPTNHAPVGTFDIFRFGGGLVTGYELWFPLATLEMISSGCFAPGKGGSERLRQIADRYLAAWPSEDKERIAALYRDDASFSDSMLGIQAQGPVAISELGDKRFGSEGNITLKVIDL